MVILMLIAGILCLALGTVSWVTTVGVVLTAVAAVGLFVQAIVLATAAKTIKRQRDRFDRFGR